MTENEAFYIIGNIPIPLDDENYDICQYQEAKAIALEALEKIQQYKALGTVEELRIAKEKQILKKPLNITKVKDENKYVGLIGKCPCCNDIVDKSNIVCDCGQKLDWSDEQ